MMRAPAAKSAVAQALSVAPVVTTSSTSKTCAPDSRSTLPPATRNASETLRERSVGVNRVCGARPAVPHEQRRPERASPMRRQRRGEQQALVVAAFAQPRRRQRHRHERRALLPHVVRPGQPCHPCRHTRRGVAPPVVLERMDDSTSGASMRPRHTADGPHERRQMLAPPAGMPPRRMPAPRALRRRQPRQPRPAAAAHQPVITLVQRALAGSADARQQQRRQVAAGGTETAAGSRAHPAAHRSARHIAPRSGSMPNQRRKASAPCSTSIAVPSAARRPLARTARTHGVSPPP